MPKTTRAGPLTLPTMSYMHKTTRVAPLPLPTMSGLPPEPQPFSVFLIWFTLWNRPSALDRACSAKSLSKFNASHDVDESKDGPDARCLQMTMMVSIIRYLGELLETDALKANKIDIAGPAHETAPDAMSQTTTQGLSAEKK